MTLGLGGLRVQDARASTSRSMFVVGRIPLVLFLICQGGALIWALHHGCVGVGVDWGDGVGRSEAVQRPEKALATFKVCFGPSSYQIAIEVRVLSECLASTFRSLTKRSETFLRCSPVSPNTPMIARGHSLFQVSMP